MRAALGAFFSAALGGVLFNPHPASPDPSLSDTGAAELSPEVESIKIGIAWEFSQGFITFIAELEDKLTI